jgi:uncharacterized protein (DUF2336 family)
MLEDTSQFQRLIDLAKEPSSEKRRELLRQVTDIFLDKAPSYNDAEREHFGAIMSRVATDMEIAVRRTLAKQFANVPSAPHSLIQQLANDDFSVAKDVLLKSTVLRDADLIAIAKSQGQEKLEAIAGRHSVSEAVSEAIVENGDDEVVVKLVSNVGAKVSRTTMQRVVERSEENEALQAPLVARADIPPDMLQDMFTFVSSELRTQIAEKLDSLPPEVIEAAFKEAEKDFAGEMRQMKDADRRAMVYVSEMARRKELTEALLHQLLRSNQMVEFMHAFGRLADIDVKTVRRIVTARNVEGVAIICKAARFDRSTFSAIVFSFDSSADRSVQTANDLMALYDKVTPESAQRVIRFWRVRKEAGDAAAPAAAPPMAQAS